MAKRGSRAADDVDMATMVVESGLLGAPNEHLNLVNALGPEVQTVVI